MTPGKKHPLAKCYQAGGKVKESFDQKHSLKETPDYTLKRDGNLEHTYISPKEKKVYNFPGEAKLAKQQRPVSRVNKDGTRSSHIYESAEADGKFVVYPTLFPKSTNASSSAKDWMELGSDQAYSEAKKRGEIIEFNDEASANAFAKGAWKKSVDSDAFAKGAWKKSVDSGKKKPAAKKVSPKEMEAMKKSKTSTMKYGGKMKKLC